MSNALHEMYRADVQCEPVKYNVSDGSWHNVDKKLSEKKKTLLAAKFAPLERDTRLHNKTSTTDGFGREIVREKRKRSHSDSRSHSRDRERSRKRKNIIAEIETVGGGVIEIEIRGIAIEIDVLEDKTVHATEEKKNLWRRRKTCIYNGSEE
eukprot:UN26965